MAKNKSNPAIIILVIGFILFVAGAVLVGVSLILNDGAEQDTSTSNIMLYGGAALAVLGLVMAIITICVANKGKSSKSKQPQEMPEEIVYAGEAQLYNPQAAEYSASPAEYEFVNVGKRQSADDKFEQIGKMGKTQFVIYIAKLFSLQGYEVRLTPVIDNHGVDMVIKKDGITKNVSCVLSNKVLCAEDIKYAEEGKSFYQANGAVIITNMYFDRTSLDFARARNWSLVDRNILAEQYMK